MFSLGGRRRLRFRQGDSRGAAQRRREESEVAGDVLGRRCFALRLGSLDAAFLFRGVKLCLEDSCAFGRIGVSLRCPLCRLLEGLLQLFVWALWCWWLHWVAAFVSLGRPLLLDGFSWEAWRRDN